MPAACPPSGDAGGRQADQRATLSGPPHAAPAAALVKEGVAAQLRNARSSAGSEKSTGVAGRKNAGTWLSAWALGLSIRS